jgi:hypothetical protein
MVCFARLHLHLHRSRLPDHSIGLENHVGTLVATSHHLKSRAPEKPRTPQGYQMGDCVQVHLEMFH